MRETTDPIGTSRDPRPGAASGKRWALMGALVLALCCGLAPRAEANPWSDLAWGAAKTTLCLVMYEFEHGAGSLEGARGFDAAVGCLRMGFLPFGTAPDCVYDDPDIDPECASLCDGQYLDPVKVVASYNALEASCSDLLAVCDRQLETARFDQQVENYNLDCEGYVDWWIWEMQQLGVDPITEEDECMLRAMCDAGVTEFSVVQQLMAPTTLGARFECASRQASIAAHAGLIAGWLAEIAAAMDAARNAAFLQAQADAPIFESNLVVIRDGAAPHSEADAANQASTTCQLYLESEIDLIVRLFLARTIMDAQGSACGDDYDTGSLRDTVADVQACGLTKGFAQDEAAKLQYLADALDAMDEFEDAFCGQLGAVGETGPLDDFIGQVGAGRSCFDACRAGLLGTQLEGVRLHTLYTGIDDGDGTVWVQGYEGADMCVGAIDPVGVSVDGCGFAVDSVLWVEERPGEPALLASYDPWSNPPAHSDGTCDRFDFSDVLEPLLMGHGSGHGGG